jgi:hypothetical protein
MKVVPATPLNKSFDSGILSILLMNFLALTLVSAKSMAKIA